MESYLAETGIEPSVTLDERETLQEVLDLMAEDKADEALELLRKEGGAASSAVFDFLEASLRYQAEDYDAAARGYLKALEKYPKFRRAWKNLAFIHARRDDFAAAARAFTRVLELGDATPEVYGLLGIAYSNLENALAAESAYRMAILLDPAARDWKLGLAASLFRQKRFADAVALFDTLIAEDPGNARLWLLQANAYVGLERPLQAAQNFEMADALGAATPASLASLGDIYVNEGLFDAAVERYLRALDAESEQPERALRAARVMTAQNALDATRALLDGVEARAGARLAPETRQELLKLRARVALAEGAGDEEARILEQIVALDPLDGEALILLGQHADRAGDAERAVFYFERAESIESSEADACVRHAQLLVREKRYPEALRLLARAQRIRPRETIQEYVEQVERAAQKR
jgi:tetratricopeptide (TPR) repeat protein